MCHPRRVLVAGLAVALAVGLANFVTWPLASRLGEVAYDRVQDPDIHAATWWLGASVDSLLRGEDPWFQPDLVWPDGLDLRQRIWNLGVQVWMAPVSLLAPDGIARLNLVLLATLVCNGLAAGWVGWLAGGPGGALLGLVIGASSAISVAEAGQGKPEQAFWAPLVLFIGARWKGTTSVGHRWSALAGLALGVAGSVYWFQAIFLGLLAAAEEGVALLRGQMDRRRLRALLVTGGVALLVGLPSLWPVGTSLLADPAALGARRALATPGLVVSQSLAVLEVISGPFGSAMLRGRLPLLALPVLLWGALSRRGGVRSVAALGLLALLFALGPRLVLWGEAPLTFGGRSIALPSAALALVPGFTRFWWPHRWLTVSLASFALVLARLVGPRPTLALLLAGLMALEGRAMVRGGKHKLELSPVEVPSVVAVLAALPHPTPVFQLPAGQLVNAQLLWQSMHHQPIDGGVGWHLASLRTFAWEERLASVPLLAMLTGWAPPPPSGPRHDWTEEETAGFRAVVLWRYRTPDPSGRVAYASAAPPRRYAREIAENSRILGEPAFSDEDATLWLVGMAGS